MEKKVGMNILLVCLFVFVVGFKFCDGCSDESSVSESKKGASVSDSKNDVLERVINCPSAYIPDSRINGVISDFSMPPNIIDIKRYSCNIDFEREIGGDELEREIRYWVGYVLGQRPDAKVISVKCFCPGQSLCFKTGTFSYTGEWNNDGNVSDEYGSYRLVIGW